MTSAPNRLPRLALWLLSRVVPSDARDAALGDLEEEFAEDALPRLGLRGARWWFWRQAFSLVRAYASARRGSADDRRSSLFRSDNMRHDLRDALRALFRSPAYSLTAVAVLGLGIGATSSIFSFVNGVLLRPLPYANPERIGLIVVEVALACMLLVGASLLMRSFMRLQQVEPARTPPRSSRLRWACRPCASRIQRRL